jgi:mRNA interferase RelE/StbE
MNYQVEISPAALRQLKKLTPDIYTLIIATLEELEVTPRPPSVSKLEGEANLYRIRVRDYRIVYQIQDKELIVLVVKIGHRKDIYR